MANILVFDSGVGGLSIAAAIDEFLPQHRLVFASDNAAYPYGTKSVEELVPRVVAVIEKLLSKITIDIVIVACNTASTVALPELRQRLSVEVVGVVPAIKPAVKASQTKSLGVLATPATVKRQYTQNLLDDFAEGCKVDLLGSSDLVDIAERKLHDGKVDVDLLKSIVEPWFDSDCTIDTIVLACTHFSLLKIELDEIFKQHNKIVQLIDSAEGIARRVRFLLAKNAEDNTQLNLLNNRVVFTAKQTISDAFQRYLDDLNIVDIQFLNV